MRKDYEVVVDLKRRYSSFSQMKSIDSKNFLLEASSDDSDNFSESIELIPYERDKPNLKICAFLILITLTSILSIILCTLSIIDLQWAFRIFGFTYFFHLSIFLLGAELRKQWRTESLFCISGKLKPHKNFKEVGWAFLWRLTFLRWFVAHIQGILLVRYFLALMTATLLLDMYTDYLSIVTLVSLGGRRRMLYAIVMGGFLFLSIRLSIVKKVMDFSEKPVLNRPIVLLAIYIPLGFFPWRRIKIPGIWDESNQSPCDMDLTYFNCSNICLVLGRFLRSICIEVVLIFLIPLYLIYLIWEVPRLSIKNFTAMSQAKDTPPEIILMFLYEAIEALPQLALQTWMYFREDSLLDSRLFWLSFTFSLVGILKSFGTFLVNYKFLVAGIMRIPKTSDRLTLKHQDLEKLPLAFVGNPKKIKLIELCDNKLQKVTANDWKIFFDTFRKAKNFSFNSNRMNDSSIINLAPALPVHQLVELSLKDNEIGCLGVQRLVRALSSSTRLTKIVLEDNLIGDEGASFIAKLCKQLSILKVVNLRHNQIGDYGAIAFAHMLKTNCGLTHLLLDSNRINDLGWSSFAEVLRARESKLTLGWEGNYISDYARADFRRASSLNRSRAELQISSGRFSNTDFKQTFPSFAISEAGALREE